MSKGILEPKMLETMIFGKDFNIHDKKGILIHIYGQAGSGKTTLGLQIAASYCKIEKKVVYIDTEGKVTGAQIKSIVEIIPLEKIDKYLKLHLISDFKEQQTFISNLEFYLKNQDIGLIVVDTITNLYRLEQTYHRDSTLNYEKLAFQVAHLRSLANTLQIPVIIINQATMPKIEEIEENEGYSHESINPVAKNIMSYWSDREIILVSYGWGKFEARKPSEIKGRVKFSISEKGIIPLE